ncbi:histidine kinase [Streptomyces ruber]|uniref:histidine kinase n=2 Tax=Streptomyces TaxID=1883 RepID=A0A918EPR7_9ACTN|nr:ATP-binding protein [Streptomyces ruber]GGQ38033.1 histidine kinase [Streptomyces ruber]
MTSPTLPGDRPAARSLLTAFLLTAVLAGLAVASAVVVAPDSVRVPLALGGTAAGLLLCAAVTVAAHGLLSARAARHRLESVTQDVGRLVQERARIAEDARQERARLTDELDRERARLTAELAQERTRITESFAAERARLTEEYEAETARLTTEYETETARLTAEYEAETTRLTEEHAAERARSAEDLARLTRKLREANSLRSAAVSATANVAGRLQALATGMLADLRSMEEKHSDEEVLTDLLHLDHRTAQAGRLADSIAVLTGARSGRRWARPISMESILRGAMGRISGYQRVRVHSTSDVAVAGHAAEGVMHALAELLDNAANFSPPTAEVHVYVEEVPAGAIVSVEDSGLVMGEVQLRRAERAVSGEGSELGGLTGTRLGLAVVGRLAKRYGLKVSYRPSARGGTGVLMLIPQDILVARDGTSGLAAVPAGRTAAALPTSPGARALPATPAASAALPSASGTPALPRRRAAQDAEATYAAALAGTDLDPDPVPTHESPDAGLPGSPAPDTDTLAHGLPRRRRGRTLAEAERSRLAGRDATPRTAPPAGDAKTRATRFGSFRQAVRNAPEGTPDQPPGDTGQATRAQDAYGQGTYGQDPTSRNATGQSPTGQDPTGQSPTGQDPTSQDPIGQNPATQTPIGRPGFGEAPAQGTTWGEAPLQGTPAAAPDHLASGSGSGPGDGDGDGIAPETTPGTAPETTAGTDGAAPTTPSPSHPQTHPEGDTTS